MDKNKRLILIIIALVCAVVSLLLFTGVFDGDDNTVSTPTSSVTSVLDEVSSEVSLYDTEHALDTEYNTAIAAAKSNAEKAEITKTYTKKWTNKRLGNYNYIHKYYLENGNEAMATEIYNEHESLKAQIPKQERLLAKSKNKKAEDYDYQIAKISYNLERRFAIKYYEKCLSLSITPEKL